MAVKNYIIDENDKAKEEDEIDVGAEQTQGEEIARPTQPTLQLIPPSSHLLMTGASAAKNKTKNTNDKAKEAERERPLTPPSPLLPENIPNNNLRMTEPRTESKISGTRADPPVTRT